jgi:hypothetical protein
MGNNNVLPEETCPICMEKFDEPYDHFDPEQNDCTIFDSHLFILRNRRDPCGHTTCQQCLSKLMTCPFCRIGFTQNDLMINYSMSDKLKLC